MLQFLLVILVISWFYRMTPRRKVSSSGANQAASREAARLTSTGICPIDDYDTPSRHNKRESVEQAKRNSDREFPVLKRLGLYASGIEGDGNCLFRAMSDQLYGDHGAMHGRIRCQVVNYMKQNSAYFSMFLGSEFGETWSSYLNRMAKDGVYGDNVEIVAFANCYHVNVVIYQHEHLFIVSCQDGSQDAMNVHIAYHDWEHYSSVRNREGPHKGLPEVRPKERIETAENPKPPQWKIKVVKDSLPHPVSDSQVEKALMENNGEISNAVETLLLTEQEEDYPATPPASSSSDSRSVHTVDTVPKETANKPRKKLTPREKKEKQKREALERKRMKSKSPTPPTDDMKPSLSCSDIKAMYI